MQPITIFVPIVSVRISRSGNASMVTRASTKANPAGTPAKSRPVTKPTENSNRAVPAIVNEVLQSSGNPLDETTQGFMEQRFRQDFGRVRIHHNSNAAESARSIQARAYTVGNHIAFGAGQYSPQTLTGQNLIAHELAHVVQQQGQSPGLQTKLTLGATLKLVRNPGE